LKLETQILEDHQAKLIVEIEPEALEKAKQRAARKIASKTKIPGFRPGKAPYPVILRTIGEGAILEEAMEILMDEVYPQALDEAGIKPYGPGSLENVPSMDPPRFEFIVPLEAEITLGDYQAIRLPFELPTVEESEVQKVLEDLRSRQAVLEPANRPAKKGDQVFIHLDCKRKQPKEGESEYLFENRPVNTVIPGKDDQDENEWPFVGFARHLVGLSNNDEKTLAHKYPEDSPVPLLGGQSVEFHLRVEEVKARILPKLNDEFAQTVNEEFTTLERLRSEIRNMLESQSKEKYEADYVEQAVTQLTEGATIKYPPQMIEHEIDQQVERLNNRLSQQKMDLDTYLKVNSKDLATLRQEMRPLAENRIRRSLSLFELSKTEKIEVTPEEVQAESARTLEQMAQYLQGDKMRRAMNKDFIQDMVGNISLDLLGQHTLDRLKAIASGQAAIEQAAAAEAPAPAESDTPAEEPAAPAETENPA